MMPGVCEICGKEAEYCDSVLDATFLNQLCDGSLVKL